MNVVATIPIPINNNNPMTAIPIHFEIWLGVSLLLKNHNHPGFLIILGPQNTWHGLIFLLILKFVLFTIVYQPLNIHYFVLGGPLDGSYEKTIHDFRLCYCDQ